MEENRNNNAVERRLKEALKQDRARIQVGRISHFGLLELSRQRLRPSLIETNFRPCSACGGTGLIRSTESASIYTLRMIEEEGIRRRSSELTVTVHPDVALYLLNYKREQLATLEARYGLRIFVLGDAHLIQPNLRIDRVKATRAQLEEVAALQPQSLPAPEPEPEVEEEVDTEVEEESASEGSNVESLDGSQDGGRDRGGRGGRGRRRRRRGRGRDEPRENGNRGAEGNRGPEGNTEPQVVGTDEQPRIEDVAAEGQSTGESAEPRGEGEEGGREERGGRRRRRGRRGGRRRRREGGDQPGQDHEAASADGSEQPNGVDSPAAVFDGETSDVPPAAQSSDAQASDEAPASGGRRRGFFSAVKEAALSWTRNDGANEGGGNDAPPAQVTQADVPPPAPTPVAQTPVVVPAPVAPAPVAPAPVVAAPAPQAAPPPPPPPRPVVEEVPSGPPKKGWWSQPKE